MATPSKEDIAALMDTFGVTEEIAIKMIESGFRADIVRGGAADIISASVGLEDRLKDAITKLKDIASDGEQGVQ